MTVREVCAALSLGRSKVYDMIQRGDIPSVRFGGSVRVPRHAFERWIEARMAEEGIAWVEESAIRNGTGTRKAPRFPGD